MNKKVVVATVVIAGSGVVNAFMHKKAITPVIIGAYVFMLVLSIVDMFGGPIASLADGLAMLAVVYVLLSVFPWSTILSVVQGKKAA
jgi:hypothetical protein